jgi:ferric-dicitrate binding protein FerR (iron transport regulator)
MIAANRHVRLQGEAYFDVSPSDRLFVVETFNATVTVLGTRFNVRAWTDVEASTFVTVESGQVRVAPEQGGGVVLAAGESVRIATDIDSVAVSVGDAVAWRQGDLIYKHRMLGAILDDISRQFDVAVRLDPTIAETTHLTLALRDPADAESVVRDLAGSLGLQYRARSNGYELYRP